MEVMQDQCLQAHEQLQKKRSGDEADKVVVPSSGWIV